MLTYADLQLAVVAPEQPPAPSRELVLKALERLQRDLSALQQRIAVRRAGAVEATPDISDTFLRLNASEEVLKEVVELYQAREGHDEELDLQVNGLLQASEAVVQERKAVFECFERWGKHGFPPMSCGSVRCLALSRPFRGVSGCGMAASRPFRCREEYCEVRSWQEYFQDEVNVTKYNVQKHGASSKAVVDENPF